MFLAQRSEYDLVHAAAHGDARAAGDLVLRYQRRAYAVARAVGAHDSDDVVQEAFLQALRQLSQLRDANKFGSWFLQITRNLSRKNLRKRHSVEAPLDQREATTDDSLEAAEVSEALWDQVERLPEGVREAIYLYYHEGESTRRVAKTLEIPASTVRKRLQIGRDLLREPLWRSLRDSIRDMVPPERTWRAKGRQTALVVLAALPVGWETAAAASGVMSTATASGSAGLLTSIIGAITMKQAIVLSLVLTLAAIGGVWWIASDDSSTAESQHSEIGKLGDNTDANPQVAVSNPSDAPPGTGSVGTLSSKDEAPTNTGATPSAAGRVIFGRVQHSGSNEGIDGARVWALPPPLNEIERHRYDSAWLIDGDGPVAGGVSAETDAEGNYRIELSGGQSADSMVIAALGFGTVLADIRGPAFGPVDAPAAVSQDKPVPPKARQERSFELERAGIIHGRVIEANSKTPAAGVAVLPIFKSGKSAVLLTSSIDTNTPSVLSDEDGEFAINGLVFGEFAIVTRSGSSDYAPTWINESPVVTLDLETSESKVELQVTRGVAVRGQVLDPSGEPAVEAMVSPRSTNMVGTVMNGQFERLAALSHAQVTSDSEGRFEIRGLRPDSPFKVGAVAVGFAPVASDRVQGKAGETIEIELRLLPEQFLSGVVLDQDGNVAAGVTVQVLPSMTGLMSGDANIPGNFQATSDEQGAFRIGELGEGSYQLFSGEINPASVMGLGQNALTVKLGPGESRSDIELRTSLAASRWIRGRVVDPDGQAMAAADISVRGVSRLDFQTKQKTPTDADGRFAFETRTPIGEVIVRAGAFAPGIIPGTEFGEEPLEIVLEPLVRVEGFVVTAAGDAPAVRGKVSSDVVVEKKALFDTSMFIESPSKHTTTVREDGRFVLLSVPDKIQLSFDIPGFVNTKSEVIDLRSGKAPRGLKIILSVGGQLGGLVLAPAGHAVQGANVRLRKKKASTTEETMAKIMPHLYSADAQQRQTDLDGRWSFKNLEAGTYVIEAKHADGGFMTRELAIRAEEIKLDTDLTLSPTGSVEGAIIADKTMSGTIVQLVGEFGMKQTTANQEGKFSFKGVPEGKYTVNMVQVNMAAFLATNSKSQEVIVTPGETKFVEFVLKEGSRIYGYIADATPKTTRISIHSISPVDPDSAKTEPVSPAATMIVGTIDAEGYYELKNLEPGDYEIQVFEMPESFDPDTQNFKDPDLENTQTKMIHTKTVRVEDKDIELHFGERD